MKCLGIIFLGLGPATSRSGTIVHYDLTHDLSCQVCDPRAGSGHIRVHPFFLFCCFADLSLSLYKISERDGKLSERDGTKNFSEPIFETIFP